MFRLVVLILVLLCVALPSAAQPVPPDGCTPDDWLDMLYTASAAIDQPDADVNTALDVLVVSIQVRRAICAGLAFEGNGGEVVGPFDLPGGNYIMSGVFSEHGILSIDTLTSECRLSLIHQSSILFGRSGGLDQSVIQTDQPCRLLATADTDGAWTLTFTPVE